MNVTYLSLYKTKIAEYKPVNIDLKYLDYNGSMKYND